MKRVVEISVNRIKVYAYHGCEPQERVVGGEFYVSISAQVEVEASAWQYDQLEGTADYSRFVSIAKREMAVPSNLLEHVAARIAAAILEECPTVMKLSVTIDKENPPLGVTCQGVSIKFEQTR
ncbi:MAG: dihydroneopterin aldolase [Bacteroidaceae bacterium]|nr:dihydroneopterin aldolase [Bacteroidaceae bacterium]MBQ9294231.1 dihydroneopterin aldolase [Bacteroidaceae bacterium]